MIRVFLLSVVRQCDVIVSYASLLPSSFCRVFISAFAVKFPSTDFSPQHQQLPMRSLSSVIPRQDTEISQLEPVMRQVHRQLSVMYKLS